MHRILAVVWQWLQGPLQWYVLWLLHDKFVVGVGGVVLDDQERVLLLRHRYRPPGFPWGVPGGYVNRGESLEEGLVREVREEVDLAIEVLSPLQVNSGFKRRLEIFYLARYVSGEIRVDGKEILEGQFFVRNQLPDGLPKEHRAMIAHAFALQDRMH